MESLFSVMSVETGVIPATVNCDNIDTKIEALNINIVRSVHKEKQTDRRILLKNSFGFGGTNASLVFESYK